MYHRVAINDPTNHISIMAIGIEKNKTNQQYQGKKPIVIPPTPKIIYKSWAVVRLLKADDID